MKKLSGLTNFFCFYMKVSSYSRQNLKEQKQNKNILVVQTSFHFQHTRLLMLGISTFEIWIWIWILKLKLKLSGNHQAVGLQLLGSCYAVVRQLEGSHWLRNLWDWKHFQSWYTASWSIVRINKDVSPIVYRSNDVDGTAHYYCSYLAVWFHYASPLLVLYFPKGQMPLLTPLVTCWVMSRELKSFLLKLIEMGQIISHVLTQLWFKLRQ